MSNEIAQIDEPPRSVVNTIPRIVLQASTPRLYFIGCKINEYNLAWRPRNRQEILPFLIDRFGTEDCTESPVDQEAYIIRNGRVLLVAHIPPEFIDPEAKYELTTYEDVLWAQTKSVESFEWHWTLFSYLELLTLLGIPNPYE